MNTLTYLALVGATSAIKLSREPLLTWSATPPATHPINYFVPDFGVSHEIVYSTKNLNNAESELGEWTPKEDAPWPAGVDTEIEFKLL